MGRPAWRRQDQGRREDFGDYMHYLLRDADRQTDGRTEGRTVYE
jgi:hypothetical protein